MKVLVFGGTTEGRELAAALAKAGIDVSLSVATEPGRNAAANNGFIVLAGRLDEDEMARLMKQGGFDCVVDATHPYAVLVTQNIRNACRTAGLVYYRLKRPDSKAMQGITYVPDAAAAVRLLNTSSVKVLLTTGSKELEPFTLVDNYAERCFVRILPAPDSLQKAVELGFPCSNIICMQGPFDSEMNMATLKMTGARILVTKDSGSIGGFGVKVSAALSAACEVIVIARPAEAEESLTYDEILYALMLFEPQPPQPPQTGASENTPFFPLFVDMRGKKVLVTGGGKVAERRIRVLSALKADVTVISPSVTEYIGEASKRGALRRIGRKYQIGDVAVLAPFLVIAATDDRQANQDAKSEAASLDILISVADSRGECSCYFPAIVENDAFIAGLVSKNGDHSGVRQMAEQLRKAWGV